jgi:hypothetical protein
MKNRLAAIIAMGVLAAVGPLSGAEAAGENGPRQSFQETSSSSLNFAPGGLIRINGSYGHLTIEGWDEPEVRLTLIKSTKGYYQPSEQKEASRRFEMIQVSTEQRSDKELAITTTRASRHGTWAPPLPNYTDLGVILDYRILAPRETRLIVNHDYGYVWVSDLTGDLEVHSHTGDMIVMLPEPGQYSIDAQTHLGAVFSDFAGKSSGRFVVGHSFAYASEAPARRIRLRMGRGSITIKSGPPFAPFHKN